MGGVAGETDARGSEIGLQRIGQTVHPFLFRAAGNIEIILLSGGRKVDIGHEKNLLLLILCHFGGKGVICRNRTGVDGIV